MSKVRTKWIEDNAVNDLKMRLRNNLALRARNAGDTADIDILKVNNSDILELLREMSMTNNKITNLADPTAEQDAATKKYVDSVVSGLTDPKDSVKVATTAALPASTYDNGVSGVGATLTGNANGALPSIDGVGLSADDRILVKNQANGFENGIYVVTQLGDAGTPFILTRATDANIGSADGAADDPNLVSQGMFCLAAQGTLNGGLGFILTTPDPITLGTTSLSFAQFGETVTAGQGISKTGSVISVNIGLGLEFAADTPTDQVNVKVDDASLIDGTTKIGSGGEVAGRRTYEEGFTLTGTDITNGYVDLAKIASRDSVQIFPRYGIKQKANVDFTVSYTGGTGGKTRVTFAGDLATILEAGDILDVAYESLDY